MLDKISGDDWVRTAWYLAGGGFTALALTMAVVHEGNVLSMILPLLSGAAALLCVEKGSRYANP